MTEGNYTAAMQVLVEKYREDVEAAAQANPLNFAFYLPGYESPELVKLAAALCVELMDVPEEDRWKAAKMLAKELVNMRLYPEVGGPTFEGMAFGFGNDSESENPDILEGADEPAPEPVVVEVKVPPKKSA